MVLPKSTVHVSRLAGTALKSFTHGYAQTVVAASQSSYASQNTPVAPLASNWLSRLNGKSSKSDRHAHFSTTATSHQAVDGHAVKDTHPDAALAHFQDAWQKHQKSEAKEHHAFQIAKRVGWKPPTTIPEPQRNPPAAEAENADAPPTQADATSNLKRSYSTSAIDNFAKAIDNEAAEAIAIAQVNESIAGEVARNKKDIEQPEDVYAQAREVEVNPFNQASVTASPVSEVYSEKLLQLQHDRQFSQIPAVFESMLRDGVYQPSQKAYRALLASATELTDNKHQKVPRVLDIYADMMRRSVVPDAKTLGVIVETLATRALDAAETSSALLQKSARLGHSASVFSLDVLERQIMSEDQALPIALKFIASSPIKPDLHSATYESLIRASASRGQVSNMIDLYNKLKLSGATSSSDIFPAMITAFGKAGDLRNAVWTYDDYRDLAIANNAGDNAMQRIDQQVYAALVQAYGHAGEVHRAKKLLARVDAEERSISKQTSMKDAIMVQGFLPLELQQGNLESVYTIVNGLSAAFYGTALAKIASVSADSGDITESVKAFDALVHVGADLTSSAAALFAVHLRINDVEAGERYFKVLEFSPITHESLQLSVLRALALISNGQAIRGLRPVRNMLLKYRDASLQLNGSRQVASERIEECIEVMARAVVNGGPAVTSVEASAEVLRIMTEHNLFLASAAEKMLAGLGADQIAKMNPADLDTFTQAQARVILDDFSRDTVGPARFAYILENIAGRSVLPDVSTENLIEKALVNLDQAELSHLWNNYRYPMAAAVSPVISGNANSTFSSFSPRSTATPQSVYDESFDPYIAQTDHKGSVVITDILERSSGRPGAVLSEALTKFRNIRRAGRHPRFFAYSKLIQAAAKANQLDTAREVLEMAKQDVPFVPHYRIVRHGWIGMMDSMVAACITIGRRDLAARYHQDILDMGSAPSANTFGLYITSLKETTKTFDEASEAVSIFLRAKSEGVEPTSFLYNALIGKLGKARRIDDCLFYFAEMRNLGIRPTSVTYGTIVNALCRVSDEKFAEEIFEEMEASVNYKPRPAPYHSLMQFFLTTKRDRSKVLAYYERMRERNIEPTMHTFKLLIDAHATIEPINMSAAEAVLGQMKQAGVQPEAVHYASLIHAKGCVLHDVEGARKLFDQVLADVHTRPQPCIYQALFESMVANHQVAQTGPLVADMDRRRVELTPYIANALIHGWTLEKNLSKAQEAFSKVDKYHREPSTYEAMVRAHLAVEDRQGAESVVAEALSRGYPSAVAGKIAELVGGGRA